MWFRHARRWLTSLCLLGGVAAGGCTQAHRVVIRSAQPPPVEAAVLHSGRLWIELRDHTDNRQCVRASGQRPVCFENVAESLAASLQAVLWPSFPEVREKRRGDNLEPGDYLLLVDLDLAPLPSDGSGPGWSAGARGRWQLVRDGMPVTGESLSSRSRAEFPYGRPLGTGAGEVIDAVAAHIGSVVAKLPELRPVPTPAMPAVATGNYYFDAPTHAAPAGAASPRVVAGR